LWSWNETAVHEEFQPVLGFFDFLETVADLGYELRFGSATRCLAIIGADGGSRTKYLLSSTWATVSFFGNLEYMRMTRSANAFVLGFKSCGFSLISFLAFSVQPLAFSLAREPA